MEQIEKEYGDKVKVVFHDVWTSKGKPFAKKYKIPMRVVIQPKDNKLDEKKMSRAYVDDGVLVNSGQFNGLNNREAIEKITNYLQKKNY